MCLNKYSCSVGSPPPLEGVGHRRNLAIINCLSRKSLPIRLKFRVRPQISVTPLVLDVARSEPRQQLFVTRKGSVPPKVFVVQQENLVLLGHSNVANRCSSMAAGMKPDFLDLVRLKNAGFDHLKAQSWYQRHAGLGTGPQITAQLWME